MSYTPTNWKRGDVITADKLNNMESGIANDNVLFINLQENDGSYTADKTVQQILSANEAGKICAFKLQQLGNEVVVIVYNFGYDEAFGQTVTIEGGGGTLTIVVLSVCISESGEETGDVVEVETNSYTVQTID